MCGLSAINSDADYRTIDFALYVKKSFLEVYEGGVRIGGFGTLQIGDRLQVKRVGQIIYYLKNNTVFYISTTSSTGDLIVDIALYQPGNKVFDVRFVSVVNIPQPLPAGMYYQYDALGRIQHIYRVL